MYDNVLPEIENDRVLVPIRAVIESFGADVAWENATSTIAITCGDTEIKMQPGNNIMIINGVEVESGVCGKSFVRYCLHNFFCRPENPSFYFLTKVSPALISNVSPLSLTHISTADGL
jgi:hypothetical protein